MVIRFQSVNRRLCRHADVNLVNNKWSAGKSMKIFNIFAKKYAKRKNLVKYINVEKNVAHPILKRIYKVCIYV